MNAGGDRRNHSGLLPDISDPCRSVGTSVFGEGGEPVGTEEFRCAPGPMGWRYFSQVETRDPSPHHETLDFAVDADWRIARMRIATGEHDILLEPGSDGTTLTGCRDNEPIHIPYGPDVHLDYFLDYFTPATNAITARRSPVLPRSTSST